MGTRRATESHDRIIRELSEERAAALRRSAVKYRWYLEVQREALGLRGDHRLDEFYRIPAPL